MELGSISPLVYGTNHGPWVAVPFGWDAAGGRAGWRHDSALPRRRVG
ncbi:MAG: hypothetical protein KJ606_13435 [Chloroflexi bacterium]|nr:hypothetical protein [Chloroflexota bacterium]